MALTVLNTYKNALLNGDGPDLSDVDVKVVLVTSGHTFDTDSDEFLDDITSGNIVMTSDNLTINISGNNVDAADGVTLLDQDNARMSSQAFGYVDTGDSSTSRLIFHDDDVVLASDGTNDVPNFSASGIFDL